MSTIWENTDGFAEQYRCANALYLLAMLAHTYNIIIDRDIGSTGQGREVVDVLNVTKKRFLSMLMKNVKLPYASAYDSHMEIHTLNTNTDIIISRGFQRYISDPTREYVFLDNVKDI